MKEEALRKEEYPSRGGCLYVLLFITVAIIFGFVIHIIKHL